MGTIHAGKKPGSRFIPICFLFTVAILLPSFFFAQVSHAAPPTVAVTSPASGLTNDNTPLLTYTVSDGTVTVKVDGTIVSKVSGDSLDVLADGPHTVRVEATNAEGTGPAEVAFIVDTTSPSATLVTKVSAGLYHTAALKSDGSLWAWGENGNGGVGDGTTISRYVPVRIGTENTWSKLSAGTCGLHTAALKTDGTLWAWGYNYYGEIGDGTTATRMSPVHVQPGTVWTVVSAGGYHTTAIKPDRTLWAWGYNAFGQVGDNSTTNRSAPVQVGTGNDWAAVSAGEFHTLAIKTDGSLWAFGRNDYGQLGDGTTINKTSPVQVSSGATWLAVSAGRLHTLAIKTDGTLWAWGYNGHGELGDGTVATKTTPIQIGAANNWTAVSAGGWQSFAVNANGELWAWGNNSHGELGDGTTVTRYFPVRIGSGNAWSTVASGLYHTAALQSDGTLSTWGYNNYGQLGNGTSTNSAVPIQTGTASDWQAVSGGFNYTMALKADGSLWGWGTNTYGQQGDGTNFTFRHDPVRIGAENAWAKISTGGSHTLAIKTDGTLWAWGSNAGGQVGDGTTVNKTTPVQIAAGTTWTAIAAGWAYSLAIRSDGTLWAWGNNYFAQLGDGTTADKTTPVQIAPGSAWTAVAAGQQHSLAIRSDGTLWAWGTNSSGQVGDGTYYQRLSSVQVAPGTTWVAIAAGITHSLAVKSDGTLWAWGNNYYAQLGDGTLINRNAPVCIDNATTWSAVAGGWFHSVALKSDGTLWAWGTNAYGQVGDNTNIDRRTPVRIGTDANWSKISAGGQHTLALKTDGTLWAWGYNAYGQLGNGQTGNTLLPSVIPIASSIFINNKAIYANATAVTLNLAAGDWNGVAEVQFSNDGTTWSSPEPYAATKSWTLSPGDGTKTVYAKFKDNAGNWSSAFSDTITLDTTPPSVTITLPTAVTTRDNTPLLTYAASDGTVIVKVDGAAVSKVSGDSLDTPNGQHTVRVESTDAAGNVGFAEVSFTVDTTMALAFVGTVSASSHTIDTQTAETSTIFYTLNGPATATLKIIPEKQGPAGTPVYQTSKSIAAAGADLFTWDGKNNAGTVVQDEAYLYILEAADGAQTALYSPAPPTGTGSVTCSQDAYNPYKNDPLTVSYTVAQPGRADLTIAWGTSPFKVMDAVPHLPGTYTFEWDGRDPAGTIRPDGGIAYCAVPSLLGENHIITNGDAVKTSSLQADPYEIHLSYGQFTRIGYVLSRDAAVTLRVVSPSNGTTITVLNNESQAAGANQIEWNGLASGDATGKGLLLLEEGNYMITVQAVNPATGTISTARGTIKIGH